MPYEETMQMGRQPLQRQAGDDDRRTEVMGSGSSLPPTEAPRPSYPPSFSPPLEGYGPSPSSAARTEILYKPPTVMAWLAIKNGPRAGRLNRLSAEVTAIGRDSHNDIVLDDAAVSRQHAKVRLEKGAEGQAQFYIYDLATANGTKVNGEQIVKAALYDGDEIEIGRTILVFKQLDGPRRPTGETAATEQTSEEEGG